MMRRIWRLGLNDLRLTLRDPPAFIWMLAMPLAMMWFFGSIGGGGSSTPPQIALDVVDRDGGWLAEALVLELTDERIRLARRSGEETTPDEPKVRTLIIPPGFTERVLAGEQQVLRLELEPGSDVQFGLAAQVHITRAIVRTLGRLIESELQEGDHFAAQPEQAPAAFRELAGRAPPVELAVTVAGRGRPVPRGYAQSVPGMLTFIVMMMTLIYGAVFLTLEKRSGMLRRQTGLPLGARQILLGKLCGRLMLALGQIVVLVAAGRLLFGVAWGNSWLGLALVLVSYASAVAALSTLLGAWLQNPEQASMVGWILAMVLAAMGGCWWPGELMPGWMRTVAHALPTTWAMNAFHSLISFGYGIEAVLIPSAVLLGFAALFTLAGARVLRLR